MMAVSKRFVLFAIGAAIVLSSAPALAGKPNAPRARQQPIGAPSQSRWRDDDSQRVETIRRAREEILRTPSQKKFILFRYGLHEDDLR